MWIIKWSTQQWFICICFAKSLADSQTALTASASASYSQEPLNIDVSWKKSSSQTVLIWTPDDGIDHNRIPPQITFSHRLVLLLWVMRDKGSDSAKVFSGLYMVWGWGSSWGLRAGPVSVPQPGAGSRGHWGSPGIGHHPGAGPMGGPGGACSRACPQGAGDWSCCGLAGTGANGHRG